MAEFIPLTKKLESHWNKPFAKLPKGLAAEVKGAFSPFTWNELGHAARVSIASQIDYNNDPAMEDERTAVWNLSVRLHDLEREKREIELLPANVPTEYATKRWLLSDNHSQMMAARDRFESRLGANPDHQQETTPESTAGNAGRGLSEHQSAAAKKRHEEHYQLKSTVLEHYQKHKGDYKNMNDAANKIAGVIVPMPQRTVYEWIRQAKKIQSAG